ncbi:hypothetical protein Slala05_80450 [Streptomyces lavendulae subsp. lavendulae]|nr:hypothetical protein Slala05_80450 [Streptomyces lavendulae subsp. lavendulae]
MSPDPKTDADLRQHADSHCLSLHCHQTERSQLADHARRCARTTTTLTGAAVDDLDLDGFEAVPEVAGITDTWCRGTDSLIAIYRGEAEAMHAPQCRTATIYAGLNDWGLRGLDT